MRLSLHRRELDRWSRAPIGAGEVRCAAFAALAARGERRGCERRRVDVRRGSLVEDERRKAADAAPARAALASAAADAAFAAAVLARAVDAVVEGWKAVAARGNALAPQLGRRPGRGIAAAAVLEDRVANREVSVEDRDDEAREARLAVLAEARIP